VDPARRRELQRFAAPAAFLAAATVAVLLIKSGLSGHSSGSPTIPTVATTARKATTATTTGSTTSSTGAARYYTITTGDTLGSVAVKEGTTVQELLRLNPGIDPTALHVGQRIRVG
jgi:LysM repeat protein